MEDRQLNVREIIEAVGMSSEQEYHNLTEELRTKKLSARWALQLLTLDHKHTRVEMSEQSLTCFQCNQLDFLLWFVTTHETWVHYFTLGTKQKSKQCEHADSPPQRKQRSWPQFSGMQKAFC